VDVGVETRFNARAQIAADSCPGLLMPACAASRSSWCGRAPRRPSVVLRAYSVLLDGAPARPAGIAEAERWGEVRECLRVRWWWSPRRTREPVESRPRRPVVCSRSSRRPDRLRRGPTGIPVRGVALAMARYSFGELLVNRRITLPFDHGSRSGADRGMIVSPASSM